MVASSFASPQLDLPARQSDRLSLHDLSARITDHVLNVPVRTHELFLIARVVRGIVRVVIGPPKLQ